MTAKTLLTVLVLATAPSFAFAACQWGERTQAASCADGFVWDADSQRCVTSTTS